MAKIQSIKFENLELKEKPYLFREKNHDRNDGVFAFKIFPDGTKDFYFIYYVNGKEKLKKIGRFGSGHNRLTLKQARDIYKVLSQKYKNGIDVKAQETEFKQKLAEEAKTLVELERRENLQGNLRQLAEFYLDYLRKNKSAKHVRNVEKALAKDLWIVDPEMKANKVTKSEILTILHPIVERGSLTMANRMRSYLMSLFKYGLDFDNSVEGITRGVQFFIEYNPVSTIVKPQKKEKVGDRVLSLKEVKQFWEVIGQSKMVITRINVFKLMIILGSRVEAIAGMKWSELDWDEQLFYLPQKRSKNENDHIIPLPALALQTLKATPRLHPIYVFPGLNGQEPLKSDGFSKAITRLCQSTGMEKFTPRDLRRTFKTLTGKAGLSKDIRDRLQYHSLSDVSSKHYDKYDYLPEKRKAMEVWNDYLTNIIT